MKKLLLICLAGLTAFSAQAKDEKPFTAVTTFTVIADLAKQVAGDTAQVVSITKPGAEIHDYEPTPKDLVRAQEADLILWNGLNLERWFERFFAGLKNVPSVVVTEGIEPILIQGGEYNGKPNPHAWMSATNAKIYVDNIANAFAKYDPKNAEIYHKNADAYKAKLDTADAHIREGLAKVPANQRWLASSEGAFSYFAKDYGLKEAYLWPINAEDQGSPKQVADLIKTVRENHIPAVFSESTVSDKPAKQVANETGARYGGVLYVDSLSTPDGKVPTYLDLLNVTAQTIIDGLTGK
ncbi:metal ABC transporter substrate-binding protein [Suttonella ornithocola]|uniref:Uncharacterized periplasmic iron-binding protein HI_0362 n=1 Tax=Suttonella ornithocola TaxID=279832 RepID=A0A380MWC1_9GAMM|nr:metal ABC transporter substrate-binding protein [Suttonella ornithocola]SUO96890.1 Uncharacterized periplasmic iron-binding protein HI_0362 precursor [Suttonella ornithocola]